MTDEKIMKKLENIISYLREHENYWQNQMLENRKEFGIASMKMPDEVRRAYQQTQEKIYEQFPEIKYITEK